MEKEIEEIVTAEEDIDKNDTENSNKEESREFYVYKHIRKDNNTCFYVGKGKGNRMYVPKRNKHFNRIRKKYGCYVVKIKENLTEKEAFALEREIIEDYVFVFGYGINIKGYRDYSDKKYLTNCTWGGEGVSGYKHSEEAKQRMSESHKRENLSEETIQKMSESHKGKQLSEEHKQNLSESHKGKQFSEEHKQNLSEALKGRQFSEEHKQNLSKKVICITTGVTFDSIKDATIRYNVAQSGISYCCIGRYKHAGELNGVPLQWKYLEDYDDNCLEEYKLNISDQRSKKVICITTGETFDSIKDACKRYKVLQSSISKCCIGKYKHAGKLNGIKLQWKYAEDDDNESKAV